MKEVLNWNIICTNNMYRAPELIAYFLVGTCDCRNLRTSQLMSFSNNVFTTYSGSEYKIVGEVSEVNIDESRTRIASLEEVISRLSLRNRDV